MPRRKRLLKRFRLWLAQVPRRLHCARQAVRYAAQRAIRGYSDLEAANAGCFIAQYALPRMRRLRAMGNSYPMDMTPEQWDAELGEMVFALEVEAADIEPEDVDWPRVQAGLELFGKRFHDLWD